MVELGVLALRLALIGGVYAVLTSLWGVVAKRPALVPMLDSVVQTYLAVDDLGADALFGERAIALVRGYKRDLDLNRRALRDAAGAYETRPRPHRGADPRSADLVGASRRLIRHSTVDTCDSSAFSRRFSTTRQARKTSSADSTARFSASMPSDALVSRFAWVTACCFSSTPASRPRPGSR